MWSKVVRVRSYKEIMSELDNEVLNWGVECGGNAEVEAEVEGNWVEEEDDVVVETGYDFEWNVEVEADEEPEFSSSVEGFDFRYISDEDLPF